MTALSFIVVALTTLLLFYVGSGKNKKVMLAGLIVLIIAGILSASGFLQNSVARPPRFLLIIAMAVIFCIYVYKVTRRSTISINYLLAVHIVRISVEFILYQLYLERKVPVEMTFKGWNYDILIGCFALLSLVYNVLTRQLPKRTIMIVWNIIGCCFLANIVGIAILSAPSPLQQFGFTQPNIAILQFPFTWLPAFVVPAVLLSHLLVIRKVRIQ